LAGVIAREALKVLVEEGLIEMIPNGTAMYFTLFRVKVMGKVE